MKPRANWTFCPTQSSSSAPNSLIIVAVLVLLSDKRVLSVKINVGLSYRVFSCCAAITFVCGLSTSSTLMKFAFEYLRMSVMTLPFRNGALGLHFTYVHRPHAKCV